MFLSRFPKASEDVFFSECSSNPELFSIEFLNVASLSSILVDLNGLVFKYSNIYACHVKDYFKVLIYLYKQSKYTVYPLTLAELRRKIEILDACPFTFSLCTSNVILSGLHFLIKELASYPEIEKYFDPAVYSEWSKYLNALAMKNWHF